MHPEGDIRVLEITLLIESFRYKFPFKLYLRTLIFKSAKNLTESFRRKVPVKTP